MEFEAPIPNDMAELIDSLKAMSRQEV